MKARRPNAGGEGHDAAVASQVHASVLADVRCPVGALIEYAGMSKWLHRHPATGEVTAYFDYQPNSYARDQGGMKGTSWRVVAVELWKMDEYDVYQVTLDPVEFTSLL